MSNTASEIRYSVNEPLFSGEEIIRDRTVGDSTVGDSTVGEVNMLPSTVHDRFKDLTLMEKWKLSWEGEEIHPKITKMSDVMSFICFLFISISELYVVLGFVIPYRYSSWTLMSQYYLKVFAVFVFIQAVANWICVQCYTSGYKQTADRPELTKQLWDEHPADLSSNGKISPREDSKNGHGDCIAAHPANVSLHWHYCYSCNIKVPPRSHHCKICKVCVLKRDHHCYMSGVCVGHHNQRYFVIMNFYIAVASLYGFAEIVLYLKDNFYPYASASDYFLPKTIYMWFVYDDVIPWEIMLMVTHCYFLWWTGLTAVGFVALQLFSITYGLTAHELHNRVAVRSTGSVSDNFQEVFGPFWGINFLFPGQILFKQPGDGTAWPNLKPDRAKHLQYLKDKADMAKVKPYSRLDM